MKSVQNVFHWCDFQLAFITYTGSWMARVQTDIAVLLKDILITIIIISLLGMLSDGK